MSVAERDIGIARRLERSFFARSARLVARDLLGQALVHRLESNRCVAGLIVETEAYCDGETDDLACHGSRNRGRPTARTAVMFGPAGHAYVYFNYGLHWLFNIVTGSAGRPGAVLIRALEPLAGEANMAEHRAGRPRREWSSGPAKLTRALGIDGALDGQDLCAPDSPLWVAASEPVPAAEVVTGPRVGLGKTPEPWLSMPWRFWIRDNPFVSAFR